MLASNPTHHSEVIALQTMEHDCGVAEVSMESLTANLACFYESSFHQVMYVGLGAKETMGL